MGVAGDLPRFDPQHTSNSLAQIAERSQRLILDFMSRRQEPAGLGMADPGDAGKSFVALTQKMMADPMGIAIQTFELWEQHFKLWQQTTQRMLGAKPNGGERKDKRFRDPAWSELPACSDSPD